MSDLIPKVLTQASGLRYLCLILLLPLVLCGIYYFFIRYELFVYFSILIDSKVNKDFHEDLPRLVALARNCLQLYCSLKFMDTDGPIRTHFHLQEIFHIFQSSILSFKYLDYSFIMSRADVCGLCKKNPIL